MASDGATNNENDECNYVWNNTEWNFIPDPVLLKILNLLSVRDILNVSECCRRWNDITKDDYLWKRIFQRDFKVNRTIPLKPGEYCQKRKLHKNKERKEKSMQGQKNVKCFVYPSSALMVHYIVQSIETSLIDLI